MTRRRTKALLEDWIPRPLWRAARQLVHGGVHFVGPYPTWDAALAASTGYDADVIVERCLTAALSVRNGDSAFEQDTVLFEEPDLSFTAATALLLGRRHAVTDVLRILDFGGSLGSTYFRCRPLLDLLGPAEWTIVEQPALVAAGAAELQDDRLRFANSVETAFEAGVTPDVLILSSVMNYLTEPWTVLERLLSLAAPVVYLDRTMFADDGVERIFVQRVPESIYPASYPLRFLGWSRLAAVLAANYHCVQHFDSFEGRIHSGRHSAIYRGGIWLRRDLVTPGIDQDARMAQGDRSSRMTSGSV